MNSTVKTVIFWLVIVVSAILLWQVVRSGSAAQKDQPINFSEFLTNVDQGNVSEVTINAQELRGKFKDGKAFNTTAPVNYPDMIKALRDKGVNINIRDVTNGSWPSAAARNLGAAHSAGRLLDLHDAADAGRRKQGAVVRQDPGAPAFHAAEEGRRSKTSPASTRPRKSSRKLSSF